MLQFTGIEQQVNISLMKQRVVAWCITPLYISKSRAYLTSHQEYYYFKYIQIYCEFDKNSMKLHVNYYNNIIRITILINTTHKHR